MSQQPGTSSCVPGTSRPNPVEFKEFNFRLPQNQKKKYSVMQFNRGDNVDLTKWKQAKLERENNKLHYKTDLDDLPKFGAGSEYGRERREEARQKKYGIVAQKYREEDQPWILRQGGPDGKTAKKYKGRKEGRINENSNYYILAQLGDGTFEAYPVDSWYNFTAMQNYRTLNAEEAEEEFGRRDKTMNYFSVMVQRKLRDTKDDDEKEEKPLKSRGSDLTLMEDDYFLDSDEEEDSDDEGGGRSKKKGKATKKGGGKKRPKKKDFDSEAEEESDEGDFDGRELDYISENSSDDDEVELAKTDIQGLDQELQQMEEDEEEEKEEKEEEAGEENQDKEGAKAENPKEGKDAKDDDTSSESSGSDSDIDEKNIQSAMLLQQKKSTKKGLEKTPPKSGSGSQSRSQTPTVPDTGAATDRTLSDAAQKLESAKKRPNPSEPPATKRPRTESPVPTSASNKTPSGHVPLTEEEVKRYLMKRPMTTKDLLVKLNPKRTGLPKEQIETKLAEILVKLAPAKHKKDHKIYWFIREHSK